MGPSNEPHYSEGSVSVQTEAPAGRKPPADTRVGHSESQGSVGSGVGAGPRACRPRSPLSVTAFDIAAANPAPLCFVTFAFSVQ